MYLPAYSPDFNPIEMAFSEFKALLRAAAARTIPDLWEAIRIALDAFTPGQCQNYFAAAGYDAIGSENALVLAMPYAAVAIFGSSGILNTTMVAGPSEAL
jgi:hypothetical protein